MTQQFARKIDEEYVETFSSSLNEPSWLTRFRKESLRYYFALPEEQSNLYAKYALNLNVDISTLEQRLFGKITETSAPLGDLAEGIDRGYYYISTQSETIASKNMKELEEKGVVFRDYHEALEKHSDLLKKIFEQKVISPFSDKYAALNSALFSSGWLAYFPENVVLESPLRVRF